MPIHPLASEAEPRTERSEDPLFLPPRSTLYNLAPIGQGTGQVESFTSYFLRLCEAHCLRPSTLYGRLIRPLSSDITRTRRKTPANNNPKDYLRESLIFLHPMFLLHPDYVTPLEKLTSRRGLAGLTLQPWVFKTNIQSLLRYNRAWCPKCYQQWRDAGQIIYDKLSWAISEMSVCDIHNMPLVTRCPNPKCNREMRPLEIYTQPGLCSKCRQWLGKESDQEEMTIPKAVLKTYRWIAHQIEQALARSSSGNLRLHGEEEFVTGKEFFKIFIACCYKGNTDLFSNDFQISTKRGQQIYREGIIPDLDELLKLSYATQIPLSVLFAEDVWSSISEALNIDVRPLNHNNANVLQQKKKQAARNPIESFKTYNETYEWYRKRNQIEKEKIYRAWAIVARLRQSIKPLS